MWHSGISTGIAAGLAAIVLGSSAFAQSAPPGPPQTVLKANTQTVPIDVVVLDRGGHPVTGLKREDFTVEQDGAVQPVTFFEMHAGAQGQVGVRPKLPEGMYSNFPSELKDDVFNVVLLDALNTPAEDQVSVRKQMISYLQLLPSGKRIAIFTLSSHLRMINGFTTDPTVLLRTIAPTTTEKGIEFSPLLTTPDEKQGQEKLQDQLLTTGHIDDKDVPAYQKEAILGAITQMRQFITDTASFNDDMRVKLTLEAMDQLARYLSPLPGRKNIIWFSASFPLSVGPDYNQADAYRMLRDYSLDVRATAQRLATARVAVYPIDARRFYHDRNFSPSEGGASQLRNGYYRSQSIDQGFDEVTREHDTMDQIAEDTGGLAIYNTGDLKRAMGEAIESGGDYYTLAYDPAEVKRDGRFHKITVKLDQPGYKLLYRHGYTAQPLKAGDVKQAKPDPKPTPQQRASTQGMFRAAMDPGAPPISEILFRVQMVEDPKQPTPADKPLGGNAQLKWPVRRYAFGYAVDVGQLDLVVTPDGHRHGILLAMTIAYDQLGGPRNSVLNTETLDLAPEDYAKALHEGLPFYQELDIPPGDSAVRVGIYDGRSQKMGATEFPLTVKMPAGQNATK